MSARATPAVPEPPEPLVELVDASGRTIGTEGKLAAHRAPGSRHRAVSVFLLDAGGLVILQQRALGKYHSGGLWSNSCCGHPEPGERPAEAAVRRIAGELGLVIDPDDLVEAGTVVYDVEDPDSGLVERELNHVFVGRAPGPPRPDPAEVAATATAHLAELDPVARDRPLTAWFDIVLAVARPILERPATLDARVRSG
jgi:isopentenyl-diphosphate delta-isomerase